MNSIYDQSYLDFAKFESTKSEDPVRKVGVVFVNDDKIVGRGHNKFPDAIRVTPQRFEKDRKPVYILHAEMVGIIDAMRNGENLEDTTVYLHGLPPCHECAKMLIQIGVARIVYQTERVPSQKWFTSLLEAKELLHQAQIPLHHIKD